MSGSARSVSSSLHETGETWLDFADLVLKLFASVTSDGAEAVSCPSNILADSVLCSWACNIASLDEWNLSAYQH